MKIGIIGAGAIGTALARNFARNGIDAVIANRRGPATLDALAASWVRISRRSLQRKQRKAGLEHHPAPSHRLGRAARRLAADRVDAHVCKAMSSTSLKLMTSHCANLLTTSRRYST
jgi:3-hydroxyacyl-CoA dehydrogenase